MAAKTRRWETRVDEETDALASAAAQRLNVSKSQFVADATRASAEEVLARSDVTVMDPVLFAELVESLDTPDPAAALRKAAQGPRSYRRA
ncbi:DUF1778 domain-containing protein [Janibacter alittae]|uniref:DUF1778 domain-containing protein n=1 Tax=Janibacter alittae TaxID=3115209 RepID=A0ABZ2MKU1_9MICO